MNIDRLSKGNILYYKKEHHLVVEIRSGKLIIEDLCGNSIDVPISEVSGVVITEAILSKYGFDGTYIKKKSDHNLYYSHPAFTKYFKLIAFAKPNSLGNLKLRLSFQSGDDSYSPSLGGTCSYLHELQNLYYCITGLPLVDIILFNDPASKCLTVDE